jgi:hypothetical protein
VLGVLQLPLLPGKPTLDTRAIVSGLLDAMADVALAVTTEPVASAALHAITMFVEQAPAAVQPGLGSLLASSKLPRVLAQLATSPESMTSTTWRLLLAHLCHSFSAVASTTAPLLASNLPALFKDLASLAVHDAAATIDLLSALLPVASASLWV